MKKILSLLFICSLWGVPALAAEGAKEPIKLGSVFEYTQAAKWGEALDRGQNLAVEEINKAGGIHGRPLQIIKRDNKEDAGETVRIADELALRDGVDLFMGTVASHTSLALSEWARRHDKIFMVNVACTDELVLRDASPNTFKIHPLCSSLGLMLAEKAAKIPAKRWGYIGFVSEYSRAVYEQFKKRLSQLRPDVVWVSYQEQPIFKLDAPSAINKIKADKPEALLDLLVVTDQQKFIRAGNMFGLFKKLQTVVSPNFGLPEEHEGIPAADLPVGWITGGYPVEAIDLPSHVSFVKAFQAKYGLLPNHASFIAYTTIKAIAAALERSKDMKTSSLRDAFTDLSFDSPIGPLTIQAKDHQSTLGFWVGTTAVEKGAFALKDWAYMPGDKYMPDAAWVKAQHEARHVQ